MAMRRVVTPELLDSDAATPGEIQQSLADLRRINRWFGGIDTTRHMLEKVIAGRPTLVAPGLGAKEPASRLPRLTLLDVGAGSGEASLAAARRLRERASIEVTLLDRLPSHLPRNGTGAVAGDALSLPFRAASFDLVTCSLLIHHFEPAEIVRFVNEALRVARQAVLLNDLRRSPLHLALVYAGFPIMNRVSRHDGVASVRRSYTPRELESILRKTAGASVEIANQYLYRVAAIVWKCA